MGKISKILIALFLFISVAHAQKLYTGGEKYEKDGVVALLLYFIKLFYKILTDSILNGRPKNESA